MDRGEGGKRAGEGVWIFVGWFVDWESLCGMADEMVLWEESERVSDSWRE